MSSKPEKPGKPLATVGDGRAARGRFAAGNRFGQGNPFAKKAQQIRAALMNAITVKSIRTAAKKLMEQAEAGDRFAFAELLDRVLGRPTTEDLNARLEALELALLNQPRDESRKDGQ